MQGVGRRLRIATIGEQQLISLRLSFKGNKGVLEKQGAGLQEKRPPFPEGWYYCIHSSAFKLPSYHPRKRREKHWPQERTHCLDPRPGWTLLPLATVPTPPPVSWGKRGRAKELMGSEHSPWHA